MNPYQIDGPLAISFSGGRTSGYMLNQIIQANDGLPDDAVVAFENTGLEHEATYQFVREVERRWNVPIVWLEYQIANDKQTYAVVDYCSASRNGEPFAALIEKRKYLPNPVTRFCMTELKIRTQYRYLTEELGWTEWDNCVGLRADEPRRVARMKGDRKSETVVMPMAEAGHTIEDVTRFWESQDFDLELPGGTNHFGNCVGCFLKGRNRLQKIALADPSHFDWWIEQEAKIDSTFRIDRPTYQQMLTQITVQGVLFDDALVDDTRPCMCHD